MKYIILFIVIFWQNHGAISLNLFSEMSDKVNDMTLRIANAWRTLMIKLRPILSSHLTDDELKPDFYNLISPNTINKELNEYFFEDAEKSYKNSRVSRRLQSEATAMMTTPQLAASHGKRVETHIVVTKDGYMITLHNLKSTFDISKHYDKILPNCTVLLHHGLLGSAADWLLLGSEKSLPYLLTNASCDIWLTNSRGNLYSRGHVSKNIDSKDFWNFSFQEMGRHDLPAVVDYIRKLKGTTEKINFIGHSMGATVFLTMLSYFPKYNEYFKVAILLAPLGFMVNSESPIRILAPVANNPPEQLLKFLGKGEFMPSRKIPPWIADKHCNGPKIFCTNPLLFLSCSVPNKRHWDGSLTARILGHIPAGGSTRTILHYAQLYKSGKFHEFGDDSKVFVLRDISVPTVLFSSTDDRLSTTHDVLRLFLSISCPVDHYIIRGRNFSHTDFVWNPKADKLVFTKVIDFLNQSTKCNISKFYEIV